MASSPLILLQPCPPSTRHRPLSPPPSYVHAFPVPVRFIPILAKSSLNNDSIFPSNPGDFDPAARRWLQEEQRWLREEQRWLQEEQRWLREEQRWLREERRWNSEHQCLLREVAELKLKIQALERLDSVQGASVSETLVNVAKLLQRSKDFDSGRTNWIAGSGSGLKPTVIEEDESQEVKDVRVKEIVMKSGGEIGTEKMTRKTTKKVFLRRGSEGEDVRTMQEALQKLGFYSGEEDMEFCSFSGGTERAVKTWQATIGVPEDGIMSAELLERLYRRQKVADLTEGPNGVVSASATEISETHHRVFLLGENRWEEPSKLTRDAENRCLTCGGDGRMLCMECDGTGEPNIEPQFLEWIDEGMKCPYCGGDGYTICDVCAGKK